MPSNDQGRLAGCSAIVTGASSGIGTAVARAMAQAGAAVAVDYHSHREPADRLVAEIEAAGGKAISCGADVSREADVAALFDQAVAAFGRVDILVANSGMQKDAPFTAMTLEDWKAVIDVDLTGSSFACARRCGASGYRTRRPGRCVRRARSCR